MTADPDPPAVNLASHSPATTASLSSTTPESRARGRWVYWSDLQPGMCITGMDGLDDPLHFLVVNCGTEHDTEVISRGTLTGSKKYPGDDAVDAAALAKCEPAFVAYVGLPVTDSRFYMDYWPPYEEDWNAGRFTLICFVQDTDPDDYPLTHSLRGAHQ